MKWVEIISLRCAANADALFLNIVNELFKEIRDSDSAADTPEHLFAIRGYHHSLLETDLSIHMYWESESVNHDKSPLGLRISSALKDFGLLNHSVWIETAALEYRPNCGDQEFRDVLTSGRKDI
jgi:hypothetical protein